MEAILYTCRAGYPDSFNLLGKRCGQDQRRFRHAPAAAQLWANTWGRLVFIAPWGADYTHSRELHGLHAAQQHQPGAVPQKHYHRLHGGTARVRPAAWQLLRSHLGQLHLSMEGRGHRVGRRRQWGTSWSASLPEHHVHQELANAQSQILRAEHIRQILHDLYGHGGGSQTGISIQLSRCQEPHHGDLQAQPESMHAAGDDDVSAVPATLLAGLGDAAAGSGQHTQHDPIPTHAGSGRESLHALRHRRRCSHGMQHQELPILCCVHGGLLWAGHVLRASVGGLTAYALDDVQARPHGYNRRSWPKSPIWRRASRSSCCSGGEATTFESENK